MRLLISKIGLALAAPLLAGCDDEPAIGFAQPFPTSAPLLKAFPVRHQGVYMMATDSTYRLVMEAHSIRAEIMLTGCRVTRDVMDSLGLPTVNVPLHKWQTAFRGQRYRLRQLRADSVWFDMWSGDTLCALGAASAKQTRWFRGSYYVCQSVDNGSRTYWDTDRLTLENGHLSWQRLGSDTLRIAVLPTGVVRRDTAEKRLFWSIKPVTRRQERQIASYAGLWTTVRELDRQ